MSTQDFRRRLRERLDATWRDRESTIVTRYGDPIAVLVPYNQWLAEHRPTTSGGKEASKDET